MWPDDEWDDEPSSGSLPDPSTRHWRHPSEIGSQGLPPVGAEYTAPTVSAADGLGWRWSVGAISGGLALVALGVVGMTMADRSTSSSDLLTAGSISPPTAATDTSVAALRQVETTISPEAYGSAESYSAESGSAAARTEGDPAPWSPGDSTIPTIAPKSPDPSPSTSQPAVGSPLAESVSVEPEPPLSVPAPGMWGPFGPAVYASPDGVDLLGSFVAVDNYLLTSARALSGLDRVYLLIDQSWIPAEVAGSDPMTDLAVLTVEPGVWELGLPLVSSVAAPIGADTTIFVGFCRWELLLRAFEAATSDATREQIGCGPVRPITPPPDLATDGQQPDEPEAEAQPGPVEPEPYEPGTQSEDPDQDDDEPFGADLRRRLGIAWSTSQSVDRVLEHLLYDLIKTSVPHNEAMAGAALRNIYGEVVGLVVGADTPNVAALPIDRALETAEAIMTTGLRDSTWVGFETVADESGGIWVTTVDEAGPATELIEPEDQLIAINGHRIQGVDHLAHLIRLAEADQPLVVTVARGGDRYAFDVVVPQPETD